jgi:hypothetical protein
MNHHDDGNTLRVSRNIENHALRQRFAVGKLVDDVCAERCVGRAGGLQAQRNSNHKYSWDREVQMKVISFSNVI